MKPNMPQLKLQVNNRHIKYAAGKLLCDRAQRKPAIAKKTQRGRGKGRKRRGKWKSQARCTKLFLGATEGGRRR